MRFLFVGNTDFSIYNYRFELVQRLIDDGHSVTIVSPVGNYTKIMQEYGANHINIIVDQHGTNPIKDYLLKNKLKTIFKKENPDFICGYTIKPNIYGAWAARQLKIPFIANITGLGPSVENKGLTQKITVALYKFAFKKVHMVFFQNIENMTFFENQKILNKNSRKCLLPGSGINLTKFSLTTYEEKDKIKFVFISRIRKDKGINEYVLAAKEILKRHKDVEFHVCGQCDDDCCYIKNDSSIIYHGMVSDVRTVLKDMNCLVFPSYYAEGLANVLLEACAMGKPIITTRRSGCRETLEENYNGFFVNERDTNSVIDCIEKFLSLSFNEREKMGLNGRKKVEKEFDRNIIVKKYYETFFKNEGDQYE